MESHFLLLFSFVAGAFVVGLFMYLSLTFGKVGLGGGKRESLEAQINEIGKVQDELVARLQAMTEIFGSRQSELGRTLNDRLDQATQRLHQNVMYTSQQTNDNLTKLYERLAVIDKAQATISTLSGEVNDLSQILGNKQARGIFGQARMEAIVADALPSAHYRFQPTLSNGKRPDCLVYLPNGQPPIVIDSKFPLEAYNMLREAKDEEARLLAARQMRTDITKHILDIGQKYLIPGETQGTAFMFVPSESLYAELHENFEELVQKAYRANVMMVSPNLLMLSIQTMQGLLRDARMREQADLIQKEVAHLVADVSRLADRVLNLKKHFLQSQKDIDEIYTSTQKIGKRGERLVSAELEAVAEGEACVTSRKGSPLFSNPSRGV